MDHRGDEEVTVVQYGTQLWVEEREREGGVLLTQGSSE